MEGDLAMQFAKTIFLPVMAVVTGTAVLLHVQAAGAAHAKKTPRHAGSYSRLICNLDGVCHTEVRSSPWSYDTNRITHGCKMSSKPGCLKWGAYQPGRY
jgi:hypothetical protein